MTHKASINITTILSVLSIKHRVPLDCQSRGDINTGDERTACARNQLALWLIGLKSYLGFWTGRVTIILILSLL